MRKYVTRFAVAATATVMAVPAFAGAHVRQNNKHAELTKQGFIVIGRHPHHARVALFVQRSRRANARTASCLAGQFSASYCTPPAEQNLFGAYSWNTGTATFGSTNSTTCKALGYPSTARVCGVYTTVPNTLIAVFAEASGNGQTMTVTCRAANSAGTCPVTFHKVRAQNAGGGDSEVWYADATSVISQTTPIFVTATDGDADCGRGTSACDVSLQAVTFTNAITAGASGAQATGIGASSACYSTRGAPTCSLTTTEPYSLVWASVNNPGSATIPTWPSNQFAIGVADGSSAKTFYSQFLGTCTANANGSHPCTTMPLPASGLYQNPFMLAPTATPTSGANVTINDTAPTTNPFNEVVVEIL
jgi:hypothetical protein